MISFFDQGGHMIMEKDKASLRVWSVRGTLMITSNCFSQWTLKTVH